MSQFAPVSAPERLFVLDVLRGVALLGILMMNIPYFALPMAAYMNLNLYGGTEPANLALFFVQWTLFEGKMRALFSMLFGAGIVLFIERAVARRDSVAVADLYVRRMLWLLLFGALHAWLIWFGDILYPYAICGLVLLPFRTMRPERQFNVAFMLVGTLSLLIVADGFNKALVREEGQRAVAVEAQGGTLTEEQQAAKETWEEIRKEHEPTPAELQAEIDAYRGGYATAIARRADVVTEWHFIPLYFPVLFDFAALMLIGMGLYRLGILQGEHGTAFYVRMAQAGYAIGLPLSAASAYFMYAWNFDVAGNSFANGWMQIGRVATALGHLAVIVLVVKRGWLTGLTRALADVGRMAFSNYIAQSVICSLIFYRPGLALMGRVERYELYYFVLGIWAFNLAWSQWWLRHYHFGPLEWCWRSLTYWERQPMRRIEQAVSPSV